MPPKRMTANPVRPARHRPGKGQQEESSSESESEAEEEVKEEPKRSAPKPSTDSTKIANNLRNVNLSERRAEAEKAAQMAAGEGFETESSGESESGDEEEESSEEESSSEDEAPKRLMRPMFIRKDQRNKPVTEEKKPTEEELWAESEARRKAKANELVQEQMEKNAAARAAGKKAWDDDAEADEADVEDTDGIEPEAEYAAWKLRELKRVKREREAIEIAEAEREEIERRRNLTAEEREAEDQEYLAKQKEDQEGKGKMGYMQKYFHKGAFFQEDAKAQGLDRRDLMGARFEGQTNLEVLPEYMQIRDMTKLGKKGRSKYKDLKTEDTGRFGDYGPQGRKRDFSLDERYQPDRPGEGGGREGPSGANATAVRERRRAPEGAPEGPREDRARDRSRDRGDSYKPGRDHDDYRDRRRPRSYSRSRSRTPPRRDRRRDSRSPPRRKRSPSPYSRHGDDKRRKVEAR